MHWGGTIGDATCTDDRDHWPSIRYEELPAEQKERAAPIMLLGKYKMYMMHAIF